ncbi:hypothetical protein Pelo_7020 [Pelomyxa schiedti]|nr:hypothetical protein Pelo_7020 [Pelomyxa schiedti]
MLKPKELARLPLHKLLVIGDGEANKTDVLLAYVNKTGTGAASETVFTDRDATVDVDGTPVRLMLRDTSGTEEDLKEAYKRKYMVMRGLEGDEQFMSHPYVWSQLSQLIPRAQHLLVNFTFLKYGSKGTWSQQQGAPPPFSTAGTSSNFECIVCTECDERPCSIRFHPCEHSVCYEVERSHVTCLSSNTTQNTVCIKCEEVPVLSCSNPAEATVVPLM